MFDCVLNTSLIFAEFVFLDKIFLGKASKKYFIMIFLQVLFNKEFAFWFSDILGGRQRVHWEQMGLT